VEEHELHLVEVNREAGESEPGAHPVPCLGDFVGGRKESGSEGIDASVVDIEGEVFRKPKSGSVEEGSGKKSGEYGREEGAMGSALVHGEGVG